MMWSSLRHEPYPELIHTPLISFTVDREGVRMVVMLSPPHYGRLSVSRSADDLNLPRSRKFSTGNPNLIEMDAMTS